MFQLASSIVWITSCDQHLDDEKVDRVDETVRYVTRTRNEGYPKQPKEYLMFTTLLVFYDDDPYLMTDLG
jgi:hypothetical protein